MLALAALVVGLGVGFGIGYAVGHSAAGASDSSASQGGSGCSVTASPSPSHQTNSGEGIEGTPIWGQSQFDAAGTGASPQLGMQPAIKSLFKLLLRSVRIDKCMELRRCDHGSDAMVSLVASG